MQTLLILLLLVFILSGVAGALVEGLLWLLVVSILLFLITGFLGRSTLFRRR